MKSVIKTIIIGVVIIFLCTICGSAAEDISSDFHDLNFKVYVLENFDENNDGLIAKSEVQNVFILDVSHRNISSLEGIEHFEELLELNCNYNLLTSLDFTQNKKLNQIECRYNRMPSIDSVINWRIFLDHTGSHSCSRHQFYFYPQRVPQTEWENPYVDISEDDWFYDDVKYAVTQGPLYDDLDVLRPVDHFSPYFRMSRLSLVQALHREAGEPKPDLGEAPFWDVTPSGDSYEALRWAFENGIINGVDTNYFSPYTGITRQDFAVVLSRFSYALGRELAEPEGTVDFSDWDQVSDYAENALATLYKLDVIRGIGDQTIDPMGEVDRAQASAILHRYSVLLDS